MFLPLLTFLSMAALVQGETKCSNDTGCVTNDTPYTSKTRPISIFPQTPESINTHFCLWTVNNLDHYQVISARNISTISHSHYDGSKNTTFIVHGYTETGKDPWLVNLCHAILKEEDVNCVCVDWSGGSSAIYFQAMNNVQVVGGEIAFLINTLVEKFNCSLSAIHLIGHSLGALAVGEAGKRQQGIGKLTVLDAARFGFEGESDEVSVDRSDANFVVALHTDAGLIGLGIRTLIGHKDFFLNGGKGMTGCQGSQILDLGQAASLVGAARDVALCSHVASYYTFIESVLNPDGFMGYCASNYSSFQEGAGFPCSNGSCSLMGFYTQPDGSSCRTYFLNTGPRFDYERWRYNVTVQSNGTASTYGSIKITLYNSSDYSESYKMQSGSIDGGTIYSALIDIRFPPPIIRVTFSWTNFIPLPYGTLWAENVTVTYGNTGAVYKFCANETTKKDDIQNLEPCP